MTKRDKREWKASWNRHRPERLVLSCTSAEATLVRELADGQTVQSYLMGLVVKAAARSRRRATPKPSQPEESSR